MGVYIPNMEMPKDGFITITVTSDGRVVGNSKKESGKFWYLDNEDIAKAVPVPPHGRLIDADEAIGHLFNGEQCLYSWDEIEDAIDATETIIPAEEDET